MVAVCEPGFGVLFESLRRDLRARGVFGRFTEPGYDGTHERDGIYLFAGPAIRAGAEGEAYGIESIAPTALHLLDVPVPADMEGPVCEDVLADEFRAAHPVRSGPPATVGRVEPRRDWASGEDEARVADHLRALGYFE